MRSEVLHCSGEHVRWAYMKLARDRSAPVALLHVRGGLPAPSANFSHRAPAGLARKREFLQPQPRGIPWADPEDLLGPLGHELQPFPRAVREDSGGSAEEPVMRHVRSQPHVDRVYLDLTAKVDAPPEARLAVRSPALVRPAAVTVKPDLPIDRIPSGKDRLLPAHAVGGRMRIGVNRGETVVWVDGLLTQLGQVGRSDRGRVDVVATAREAGVSLRVRVERNGERENALRAVNMGVPHTADAHSHVRPAEYDDLVAPIEATVVAELDR